MKKFIEDFKFFLEKLDNYRNEFLYLFIRPYWPRAITPNQITWLRVFISFVLFILLFGLGIENKLLIVSLFLIGSITDLIDGPVARGTNRVTEFGAMLDSTADRFLIIPIAVYSLYHYDKWLLLILIMLEITNAIVSLYYKSKEIYLESNIFGKTKMTIMAIVFFAILYMWPAPPSPFFVYVLWATIPFSILSMFARALELNDKGHIKSNIIKKSLNKYND